MRRKTFLVHFLIVSMAAASAAAQVPGEVVFPQAEWVRITPRQAGLNADKFRELLAAANVHGGGWGGNEPAAGAWGAVLTRGGYLVQLWDRDLKEVIDERLFSKLGIPPDRWDWLPGKYVYDTKDFYPDIPGYGQYLGPPYEIHGHIVRGGPGWVVMSASDLARFGLLIATGGIWKGERLVGSQWLRGHAGLDIHVVAGDPATKVSIAKINTKDFPFGSAVGTQGKYSFPPELVAGPVNLALEASRPEHRVVLEKGVRIPLRDGKSL